MSGEKHPRDDWRASDNERPADGQAVDWVQSNGDVVCNGRYRGRLWFLSDGMYVYYAPKFWRPAVNLEAGR